MKTGIVLAICVAALAVLAVSFVFYRNAQAPVEQACTLEAKLCPDGTAVGRTGPNCEFATCPGEEGIEEDTTVYNSGVTGSVMLGPTCPVERDPPDPECADKPYATVIQIFRSGSNVPYLIGNSDAEGKFKFSLPPGSYRLSAGGAAVMPTCAPITAAVVPNEYTKTEISCDSGIR